MFLFILRFSSTILTYYSFMHELSTVLILPSDEHGDSSSLSLTVRSLICIYLLVFVMLQARGERQAVDTAAFSLVPSTGLGSTLQSVLPACTRECRESERRDLELTPLL